MTYEERLAIQCGVELLSRLAGQRIGKNYLERTGCSYQYIPPEFPEDVVEALQMLYGLDITLTAIASLGKRKGDEPPLPTAPAGSSCGGSE